jgi:limonene-1,2-epoxide hydrolase
MASHPFRAAVEAQDLDAMVAELSPDVRFWSPVTFKPFEGRDAVAVVLGAVLRVFEDFRYVQELEGDDALALVFEATVGGRELTGVDLLRFDADGLIETFTVMVRPLSATMALRDAMGRELGVAPPG